MRWWFDTSYTEKIITLLFIACCFYAGWLAVPGKTWPVDPKEVQSLSHIQICNDHDCIGTEP